MLVWNLDRTLLVIGIFIAFLGIGLLSLFVLFDVNCLFEEVSIYFNQQYEGAFYINRFQRFFTYERASILHRSLFALGFLLVLFSMVIYKFADPIKAFVLQVQFEFYKHLQSVKKIWYGLPRNWRIIIFSFLSLMLFVKIGMSFYLPFYIDEQASYFGFVRPGLGLIVTYYPEPNNHVFFNIVCWVFDFIDIDPKWIMRLPSIIFGMLSLIIVVFFFLHQNKKWAALISILIMGLSYSVTIYSVHGRGYAFLGLMAIVSSIVLIYWLKCPQNKFYTSCFVIANVLGISTVPSFVIITSGFMVFLVIEVCQMRQYVLFKQLIVMVFCVSLMSLVFYVPIILVSGLESLVANQYVINNIGTQLFYEKIFPVALMEVFDFMIGMPKSKYIILSFNLFLIITYWFKSDSGFRKLLKMNIIVFFVSIVFYLVVGVFPPQRVFTPNAIISVFSGAYAVCLWVEDMNNALGKMSVLLFLSLPWALLQAIGYKPSINQLYGENYLTSQQQLLASYNQIYKDIKGKKVFVSHHGFRLFYEWQKCIGKDAYAQLVVLGGKSNIKFDYLILEDKFEQISNVNFSEYKLVSDEFGVFMYEGKK